MKIDILTATQPLASSSPGPLSLLLRPGLDGVCDGQRCLMPWQLVALGQFNTYTPLPFIEDLRFGSDPAALRRVLARPGDEAQHHPRRPHPRHHRQLHRRPQGPRRPRPRDARAGPRAHRRRPQPRQRRRRAPHPRRPERRRPLPLHPPALHRQGHLEGLRRPAPGRHHPHPVRARHTDRRRHPRRPQLARHARRPRAPRRRRLGPRLRRARPPAAPLGQPRRHRPPADRLPQLPPAHRPRPRRPDRPPRRLPARHAAPRRRLPPALRPQQGRPDPRPRSHVRRRPGVSSPSPCSSSSWSTSQTSASPACPRATSCAPPSSAR
jgi:hypothetical protein